MKQITFILLISLAFSSCSSPEELRTTDLNVPDIIGKWKLVEYYVSPGGETTWQTAEDGYEYTFTAKGDFMSSQEETCPGTYALNGEKIVIKPTCEGGGEKEPYTMIINSINQSDLELRFEGCIEACIYRFKKLE
ncbi:lipocalin family protein [Christiangramia aquimixticola]|uniref:lipocalin family protein n=1 Tax=Christiangramia aquimixticola TaxID=1697558 RepID=UPI003AA9583C